MPLLANGKPDRLALRGRWRRRSAVTAVQVCVDPDAHPLPRHHRARGRAAARATGAAGGSGARSWSTTPRSPSPGCAAPRRPRPATGRRRCATSVPVNVTVPAVGPERAHAIVRARRLPTAKVKVAEPGPDARPTTRPGSRRSATRSARPAGSGSTPTARWDVDDGGRGDRACWTGPPAAWSTSSSRAPRSRTWPPYAGAVDVPIAADESIRRAADPYRVRDLEAADVAVLKVQPLGGVRACLRIAEDIGLPVVVSSALETSVGIAAGVALAAALPELPYACGLATVQLLTDDVRRARCCRSTACCRCGVPAVDEAALDRLAAAPDRVAHWEARLAAVRGRAAAGSPLVNPSTALARAGRHRAGRGRRHRDRARARLAQRAAVVRGVRRGRGRAAAAAHPDRRALRRLPRARADPRSAPRGRGRAPSGTARRQPAPGGARGRARRRAARRRHRRPAGPAARHQRQPDHRPGRHLRPAGRPTQDVATPAEVARRSTALGRTSTSSSTTRWCPRTAGRRAPSLPSAGRRGPRVRGWATASGCPTGPAHRRGGRRRRRPAGAGAGRARRAGRCSPSRPAARAPARTRCAATGCCSTPTSADADRAGRRRAGTRPCPGRSPGCWPATTSRSSPPRRTASGRERPFRVDARAAARSSVDAADDPAWLEEWRAADRSVARQLDALLAAEPGTDAARGRRRGRPRAAARRAARRRRVQPDPRPRPDGAALRGRRPAQGDRQPRPVRHRRRRLHRDRRRPRPRPRGAATATSR